MLLPKQISIQRTLKCVVKCEQSVNDIEIGVPESDIQINIYEESTLNFQCHLSSLFVYFIPPFCSIKAGHCDETSHRNIL